MARELGSARAFGAASLISRTRDRRCGWPRRFSSLRTLSSIAEGRAGCPTGRWQWSDSMRGVHILEGVKEPGAMVFGIVPAPRIGAVGGSVSTGSWTTWGWRP